MGAENLKILVIEDDPDIQQLLSHHFQQAGYRVEASGNGAEGLKKAREKKPDMIVLDLMLPGIDGLEVCRALKNETETKGIPVLMLSAKSEEIDKVVGFELGADDYLSKPFSPRELLLRVKAVLRRTRKAEPGAVDQPIRFGELEIDPARHKVSVVGKPIELTAIEFKLLNYLLETKGRVQTRDTLLDKVWGYDAFVTTRTVDTHVKRLREKLGPLESYIETVRGIGYRFKEKP
ncbi:MAG TPA: DNA-binding response regulator [Deltaproteobacteria bacterium]|nr:DNA-binding response regulator [Deltaproteobacteria bacterium]